jgi:hypothetical protein
MAKKNNYSLSQWKILLYALLIGAAVVILAILLTGVKTSTNNSPQASLREKTHKAWEFNGSSTEGWYGTSGVAVSVAEGSLVFNLPPSDLTVERAVENDNVDTSLPYGNKFIKIALSVTLPTGYSGSQPNLSNSAGSVSRVEVEKTVNPATVVPVEGQVSIKDYQNTKMPPQVTPREGQRDNLKVPTLPPGRDCYPVPGWIGRYPGVASVFERFGYCPVVGPSGGQTGNTESAPIDNTGHKIKVYYTKEGATSWLTAGEKQIIPNGQTHTVMVRLTDIAAIKATKLKIVPQVGLIKINYIRLISQCVPLPLDCVGEECLGKTDNAMINYCDDTDTDLKKSVWTRCWNEAFSQEGKICWRNGCKGLPGTKNCTQAITCFTDEEMKKYQGEYQRWLDQGKPVIPMCQNTVVRPTVAQLTPTVYNRKIPCFDTVYKGGDGQYYWRDSCRGYFDPGKSCATVMTLLNSEELELYKMWLASGKPYIPGCPVVTPAVSVGQ